MEYPPSVEAELEKLRGGAAEGVQAEKMRQEVAGMRPTLQRYLDTALERRLVAAEALMQHLTAKIANFHAASEERQEKCRSLEEQLQAMQQVPVAGN
eukprot:TRINITY_DN45785_c0_g1_i1.p3 TRINITY_DN45785_c0_g1~~TRINITY_DN45785_c0_g1_i1.p3  ORF type:complete len:105 (+),score=57.13 TRINITY_DN45785_c0_g1_i1:25-315(+)